MSQFFSSFSLEELKAALQGSFEQSLRSALKDFKPQSDKRFYTRQELCSQLGISLPTLDGLIRSGKIKSYRIGARILFKVDEIDSFLETQKYI